MFAGIYHSPVVRDSAYAHSLGESASDMRVMGGFSCHHTCRRVISLVVHTWVML
jgi:hypothetical protein